MAAALSPGEQHEAFTEWTKARGVGIEGVTPARFVGRGLGVVAQSRLKVREHRPRNNAPSLLPPWRHIGHGTHESKTRA